MMHKEDSDRIIQTRPKTFFVDLQSTSHYRTYSIGTHTTVKVGLQEVVGAIGACESITIRRRSTGQNHSRPKRIFLSHDVLCNLFKVKRKQKKALVVQGIRVSPFFRKVMVLWLEHYALSIDLSFATLF